VRLVAQESLNGGAQCVICSLPKVQGIRICGQWICSDCEREIVKTDVTDAKYPHFVEAMKKIWLSALS
jgi:hypothetical protein